MQESYSEFVVFFHDRWGSNVIAGVWRPELGQNRPFKVRTYVRRYKHAQTQVVVQVWSVGRTAVSCVLLKELHQLDQVFFAAMDTEIHQVRMSSVLTDVKDIYSFLEDPH